MNKKYVVCVFLLTVLIAFSGCIETGKGYSIDTIYGIQENGLIWKTWDVWLTNDHPSQGSDGNSYSAIYSVPKQDTLLVEQIQLLSGSGKKVKVYYRNELLWYPWDYSSGTIIYKVEAIP